MRKSWRCLAAFLVAMAPTPSLGAYNPATYAAPANAPLTTPYPQLPTITADSMGMKCDGSTNDQTAWAAVISFLNTNGGNLLFPAGGKTCIINGTVTISGTKGVYIDLTGATLKIANGAANTSSFIGLTITGSNVVVKNGTINGNLSARTGTAVNQSPNVFIKSAHNVVLENLVSNNSVSDGIYVAATNEADPATYPTNITLNNVSGSGSYRNNVSLIDGNGIYQWGGTFSSASGTAPMAGEDLESNSAAHSLLNVYINGTTYTDNAGFGLSIGNDIGSLISSQNIFVTNIHVDCTNTPTSTGMQVNENSTFVGTVSISNCDKAFTSSATLVNIGSLSVSGGQPPNSSASVGFDGAVSGYVGSISLNGIDESANGAGISAGSSNGMVFNFISVVNTTGPVNGNFNVSIGGNTKINSAFFLNDYNDHIAINTGASPTGNNIITNVLAINPHLGIGGTSDQAIIKPGFGDVLDNIVATGLAAADEFGIRYFSQTEPSHIGYTKLLNFGEAAIEANTGNAPSQIFSGAITLTSIVQQGVYTGLGGDTATLALSSLFTENAATGTITIINSGSGALTVAAGVGDSLVGGTTIAATATNSYRLDVKNKVWYALQ